MKKALALILVLSIFATLAGCAGGEATSSAEPAANSAPDDVSNQPDASGNGEIAPPSSPHKYSVAGGSIGGTFFLMGGGIAQILNQQLPEFFVFSSEATGGGSANLSMLQSGEAELGIANTSSIYEAYQGEKDWTGGVVHDKVRGVLALYPTWFTCYTLEGSGITCMEDLNGKIVGVGGKGMSMDFVMRDFFDGMGIIPAQIHNDGLGATATALSNGVIDAGITFSYPPFAAISELESTKSVRFIGLTEEEQAYMVENNNYFKIDSMPAGSYKGTPDPVPGVSEWSTLVASSDVPADEIYLITKAMCENQADLIAVHRSAENMTPENALNFNVPLHAGAVRYLKEVGVEIPDELIPPEYTE